MIPRLLTSALLALVGASLCACATPARFEWGGYEGALYAYAKKPERRPDYQASLETAVSKGRASNRVAPGMLAELGYLYLEDGDTAKAIPLFEEEMRRFPESTAFMSTVIERAKKSNLVSAEVKS